MYMKRVLVIFGGCSTEYEVSLTSASAVLAVIDRSRYEVLHLGITREGGVYYYEGGEDKIANNTWQEEYCYPATISMSRGTPTLWVEREGRLEKICFDIAFPILHGKCGEDGTLQGLCEMAGIPLAGCDMESSVIGMDKVLAHTLVSLAGIRVPKSIAISSMADFAEKQAEIEKLGFPLFVKPVRAGSSFGISRVLKWEDMEDAVKEAFLHDKKVVIEESISGFEVGCAVMGNEELTLGRVDEIELSQGFFDYEEKYTLKTSSIHMPARISEEEEQRIKETAAKIYRTLGCRGFTRVDMFFTKEKEIVFNEINTIPGFTSHSRFPNMMKGVGMEFGEVVDQVLELAVDTR
ncbi:MAG: D-alanine--D-serine ligase VanG [Lachnospiraceae bacterium]|nr:D-alanine--D-serine ligase VanG [Lachnospiraceae bacterium]